MPGRLFFSGCRALICAVVLVLAVLGQASGQSAIGIISGDETTATPTLPDPLTPETIREMVSRLSDAEVRQLLLERLDAVAAEQDQSSQDSVSLWAFLKQSAIGVYQSITEAIQRVPMLGAGIMRGFENFIDRAGWTGLFGLLGLLGGIVAVALGAEYAINRLTHRWREKVEEAREPETLRETLKLLGLRLLLDMVGLFTFFAVGRAMGALIIPDDARPLAYSIIVDLVAIPRLVAAVSRFLLAPKKPGLRLISTDDWTARYLHRSLIGLALLMGLSIFIVNFMAANGVPMGETRLGFWLNVAIFVWLGVLTVRARRGLAMMARGWDEDITAIEERVAWAYPISALLLVILGWLVVEIIVSLGQFHLLQGGTHFITLGLLLMSPAMDTAIRGLVRHLAPPMQGEGALAERAWKSSKRAYIRIGRIIVFGLVVIAIAGIWDISFTNLASAGVGAQLAARLITVLMIFAAGYLVWEVSTLIINRKLANEMTAAGIDPDADEIGGEGGGTGGSRLSTILPLTRLAVQTTIIVMTVLIALGNLGIDITPLLAGAGIVGLAIGFGAQTLVRDIVSGLFFLIDDAFRIGEYLVIDTTVGTVEKISIRSLQLRHPNGPVHTIPYGDIPRVTNNSRDWVIVKMRFTVPFDTDVNKIKKLFKQIGKDVMEQPYADDILQTFKSQGVNSVDDVGLLVRGKFMCKPGKQWVIRKDIYSRVQKIFAENGIEFARREVRVNIPGLNENADLDDDSKRAVAAAANEAAQAAQAPGGSKQS